MILNYMFKNMDTGNEFSEIPLETLGFTSDWKERLQ